MAKSKKQRSKEEIMAGFTAYQEKLKQRRATKVTPESIERALAQRKAAREAKAAARDPKVTAQKIKTWITVGLLVASAAVALGITSSQRSFEAASLRNDQTIADLSGDLEVAKSQRVPDAGSTPGSVSLESQLTAARTKARKVADLQQQFAVLMRKASTEDSTGNGAPNKAFLSAVEHRRTLAPYFDRESYVVQGEDAYSPNSTNPFDADEIDPRFPWYVRYESGGGQHKAAAPTVYSWELASVMLPEDADPDELDVTWLCRDEKTGSPLAWATASYDVASQKFYGLSVGTTTLGDKYVGGA